MTNDHKDGRWPVWALSVVSYPFAAGAAFVNLFFLSLMWQEFGFRALSTMESTIGGVFLGVPLAWIGGRWLRGMIDKAEDSP
ncbi:hypothetical protein RXV86_14095 [Alisedimentitalea sp. MJ-SS2]|uniref:hypothetical protein n=1 Tax=Aliisedimentitalea sp. MJ-SS2 TaxID=3049795 RepID=UPI00290632B7|nr:hypothetical protein [Alisedimentitalea sp. MJ-SS2]MDU8928518.1 hypothetical protein [Alisedimentitalea sp. MJ-SS2]